MQPRRSAQPTAMSLPFSAMPAPHTATTYSNNLYTPQPAAKTGDDSEVRVP